MRKRYSSKSSSTDYSSPGLGLCKDGGPGLVPVAYDTSFSSRHVLFLSSLVLPGGVRGSWTELRGSE